MKVSFKSKTMIWVWIILAIFSGGCQQASQQPQQPQQQSQQQSQEPSQTNDADVFVIREKMFIAQCNDIYLNPKNYMNRTIQVEGMYGEFPNEEEGTTYRCVYRNGPGCCGNDGVAGFEMRYDGNVPKVNDWIQVTGKIELDKEGDREYVVLKVTNLKVLEQRGAEFVSN